MKFNTFDIIYNLITLTKLNFQIFQFSDRLNTQYF